MRNITRYIEYFIENRKLFGLPKIGDDENLLENPFGNPATGSDDISSLDLVPMFGASR